ncbi:hypothetical protein [Phyllobacterium leguminum]|uniref:Uncharacterized protein n=1 Tax=Phyllobacterium leguminum TaxID=314237 RepID=A0A318TJY8_9HYPH|nr:hypothetical protein [Phyllobacterium leguminum]PYE89610.1 hypothetical protein C7477_103118 [Phyllobacterium leguminum]
MKREVANFENEAALCNAFIAAVKDEWDVYPETAGFDILLSRKADGAQIGIEAKLALNAKVLDQALPYLSDWSAAETGPDYRAVLVPDGKVQGLYSSLCRMLGITIIMMKDQEAGRYSTPFFPYLPGPDTWASRDWHQWCPNHRCSLPDYIPDVEAGHSAPVALTEWKIKAIKLAIVMETRPVTRADFKVLGLSPSRWTDPWTGWLDKTPDGYVPGASLPDFKAQHPVNYEQIKADADKWMLPQMPLARQGALSL